MSDYYNSYDFTNNKRSVQEVFEQIIKDKPILSSLIRFGSEANNTKEEWVEDVLTPVAQAITNAPGTGNTITLADTSGIRAGSILRFTSSANADYTELVKVATVVSDTELTVTRTYDSTTSKSLATGDIAILVSSPSNEGTSATVSAGREPGVEYNYTQIFEDAAKVSRTQQKIGNYGIADMLAYQVANKLALLSMQINNATIWGRRIQRTSSAPGTLGGILQFLNQSGGNIKAANAAISATILNDALQLIYDDGGFSNNFCLLMNQYQARKISAFNTSGTNPLVMINQDSKTTGNYISTFVGDLPVQSGFMAKIVVDPTFPQSQIAILDLNKIEYASFSPMTETKASLDSDDFVASRLLTELTLRIKNAKQSHAIITGLS